MKLRHKILTIAALVLALSIVPVCAQEPAKDGWLVQLEPSVRNLPSGASALLEPVSGIEGLYLTDDPACLEELAEDGSITYLEPNYILDVLEGEGPDDPYYDRQWTLPAVKAEAFYGTGLDGDGAVVAVIDSGLDIDHEDLAGIRISEYSKNFLGDGSGEDAWYRDQKGHGSFVTSRIAAQTGNGKGIASIAPSAEIMVLRCISGSNSSRFKYDSALDSGSGSVAVISEAIRYAADNGADVINLSIGGKDVDTVTLQNAVNYANGKGVIVVAAAGNAGSKALYYPAACSNVIGVGATKKNSDISSLSQYNESVDTAAPGDEVWGIDINEGNDPEDTYTAGSGTSYSAPVVSAIAAIAKQVSPDLDCRGFLSLLMVTSRDMGDAGRDDHYGYGIPDCAALLDALLNEEYDIEYVLPSDAELGDDAEMTYSLNMTEAIELCEPYRKGYTFAGWYDSEEENASKITEIPAGFVAQAEEASDGDGYVIPPLTLYSRWLDNSMGAVRSVCYGGRFYASPESDDEDCTDLTILVAKDTFGDGEAPDTDESILEIIPADEDSTVCVNGDFDEEEGGFRTTFTVENGDLEITYNLKIRESEYYEPSANKAVRSDSVSLASADGRRDSEDYEGDMSRWFENADEYEIVSCSGSGLAQVSGTGLYYETGEDDYEGQTVEIVVSGYNDDFAPEDCVVTLKLKIKRFSSNSDVYPSKSVSVDNYNDDELEFELTLYDNVFTGVELDGEQIPSESYLTATEEDVSGTMILSFTEDWIRGLTAGEYSLKFMFSSGKPVSVTLNVGDSTPSYTAEFYIEEGGEPFKVIKNIAEGSSIGKLPEGKKDGMIFLGWFTDPDDPITRVTERTVVTEDMIIYASWREGENTDPDPDDPGEDPDDPGEDPDDPGEDPGEDPDKDPDDDPDSGSGGGGRNPASVAHDVRMKVVGEGDVSVSPRSYVSGKTVSVSVIPAGGWELVSVDAENDKGTGINVTGYKENIYRLTMPSCDVTVTVTFREINKPAALAHPFTDVSDDAYYNDAVLWAFNAEPQVTDGVAATLFGPDRTCTRGQVVTFLWRACGCPEPETSVNPFADVNETDYFYKAVLWAVEKTITDGTAADRFSPGSDCTNAHILTFIWRAMGREGDTGAEKGSLWWSDALAWAEKSGLLTGTGGEAFDVQALCPRCNVVEYLYRYSQSVDKCLPQ